MERGGSRSQEDKKHPRKRRTDSWRPSDGSSSRRDSRSSAGAGTGPSTTVVSSSGRTIDRYVPPPLAPPTPVSTYSRDSSHVPESLRSRETTYAPPTPMSTDPGVPRQIAEGHGSGEHNLRKKRLSHKDLKPGMVVWAENRELEILSRYFGRNLLSRSAEYTGAKHLELVLSKSKDNDPRPHVRTLMLTTFAGAQSLAQRGVYKDKWGQCVPRWPAMQESEEQHEPVSFIRGLRNEGITPGWILIHARNLVHADRNGQYECFETEIDRRLLNGLSGLAKSNENAFAIAARDMRDDHGTDVKLAEPYAAVDGTKRRNDN